MSGVALLGGGDLGRLGEAANPAIGADIGGAKVDGGVSAREALRLAEVPAATGVRLRLGYEGDGGYADDNVGSGG